ncbi:hypothetical protein ABZT02_07685 [Streptomyces sp. NPDC005402]|uniref:hypothetical protein n=1 Tax=Streptomyces sp. NPDC005402 TaxID=3155338 RepID=UPI0033B97E9A
MRWLILGALLGLLLAYPSLLAVVSVVAAIVSKPVLVAFGLGLAARPHLPRRWAR